MQGVASRFANRSYRFMSLVGVEFIPRTEVKSNVRIAYFQATQSIRLWLVAVFNDAENKTSAPANAPRPSYRRYRYQQPEALLDSQPAPFLSAIDPPHSLHLSSTLRPPVHRAPA